MDGQWRSRSLKFMEKMNLKSSRHHHHLKGNLSTMHSCCVVSNAKKSFYLFIYFDESHAKKSWANKYFGMLIHFISFDLLKSSFSWLQQFCKFVCNPWRIFLSHIIVIFYRKIDVTYDYFEIKINIWVVVRIRAMKNILNSSCQHDHSGWFSSWNSCFMYIENYAS